MYITRIYPILFVVAIGLASCEKPCDEPDIGRLNGLKLKVPTKGEDAFTEEELADLMFVRYVPFSDPLIGDTLFVNGNNLVEGPGKFIINDEFPFTNQTAPYFVTYNYIVEGFTAAFFAEIENITLRGEYTGDCDYINMEKRFVLNGDSLDLGGQEDFFVLPR